MVLPAGERSGLPLPWVAKGREQKPGGCGLMCCNGGESVQHPPCNFLSWGRSRYLGRELLLLLYYFLLPVRNHWY